MFKSSSGQLRWHYVPFYYPRDRGYRASPIRYCRNNRTRIIKNVYKPDHRSRRRNNYFVNNKETAANFTNVNFKRWY